MNTAEPHDGAEPTAGTPTAGTGGSEPAAPLRAVPPPAQDDETERATARIRVEPHLPIPPAAQVRQGRRAGLVTRTVANTIDAVIVVVLLTVVYFGAVAARFLLKPQSFTFPSPGAFFALAGFLGMLVVYLTICWATTGRTYGDHVLGLRVVNFRGRRMRWLGAFMRAVFSALFPIGLLWLIVSPENRSIQDVVLRTSVVYDWLEVDDDAR